MDKEKIINIFYKEANDLIICREKEFNKITFPLIIIHQSGFYIFFDTDIKTDKNSILDAAYQLQLFFNTNRLNFNIYSITDETIFYLNPFSDEVEEINNLEEHINNNLSSYTIDENKFNYYKEKISQYLNNDKKIKTDNEGNTYIKKGNKWLIASNDDQDLMFKYTLFGGFIGLHKFKQRKKYSGILYFLTGGLLGIGWVFDILAMVLGVSKDAENRYYLPLSDKRFGIIGLCCSIPLSFILIKLYSFILTWVSIGITSILVPVISSFM